MKLYVKFVVACLLRNKTIIITKALLSPPSTLGRQMCAHTINNDDKSCIAKRKSSLCLLRFSSGAPTSALSHLSNIKTISMTLLFKMPSDKKLKRENKKRQTRMESQ